MNNNSISRQLILTMVKVSLITTFVSFATAYLLYTLGLEFDIISMEELNNDHFNLVDLSWFILVTLSGLIISILLGIRLSRRFLAPIQSLAASAMHIRQGNLSARAEINPGTALSELSTLIQDFNAMATQLELSVENASIWNAAIAHELRTPVTILQGRLHGIIDGVFDANEVLFKDLLRQVEQLSLLIEDLRTLSLADNQQLRLNFGYSELHQVIEQSIDSYQSRFNQAGLKIQANLSDEQCYCDSKRIEQVLNALFENAVRYAQPGLLKISSKKINQDWLLQLEDEGPGIPEHHIPYLFDSFYRIEQSRGKDFGGTGLGLAVVQAIVHAHQGYITYSRSKTLGGSCFSINIRAEQPAAIDND
ncbi:two-component system sensor histidine kinase AdeS [Acinetobacter calcoaceticus]|uniref:histidine kinase n=1 Tax=Acinetobacter calcoaceticus TaxID=471 RepID=A0A4R1XUW2_ACICA|nr:two-component system sensor histidine kinase AdeS [Acinetobacter calcoaceticus]